MRENGTEPTPVLVGKNGFSCAIPYKIRRFPCGGEIRLHFYAYVVSRFHKTRGRDFISLGWQSANLPQHGECAKVGAERSDLSPPCNWFGVEVEYARKNGTAHRPKATAFLK